MRDTHPEIRAATVTFDVLSRPERVEVLRHLQRYELPVSTGSLAAHVGDRYHVDPPPDDSGATDRRVELTLHHVDLPRLADAGILSYDRDVRAVTAIDESRLGALVAAGQETLASLVAYHDE